MNRSPVRAVLGALLVVGVAATALISPTAAVADDSSARGIFPVPPEVGSCHALSWAEFLADSDADPAVACDGRHTSRTFVVRDAPADTDLTSVSEVGAFAARVCGPAWRRAINTDQRRRVMSGYAGYGVFVPTPQQQRAGARWVRCDIVLFGGRNALAPLPAVVKTPAVRAGRIPDREARCYTGGQALYVTVCSRAHAYRVTHAFAMRNGAYPTPRAFGRTAARKCTPTSRTPRRVYLKPTRSEWKNGYRFVHCLDVTRR